MFNFETLPNFFIIGAAKAGTTTLYKLLNQHPQIYLPFAKETSFFSNDNFYRKGIKWYSDTYYKRKENYTARGDATPHYLYWSEKVAPRIYEIYKPRPPYFLVIVRDPVRRAYSFYWQVVREGKENLTFREALEREDERLRAHIESLKTSGAMTWGYYRGGCYASLLQPFLDRFPQQRFLFLLQEDLRDNFEETVKRTLAFLGVDANYPISPAISNAASLPRNRDLHRWLRQPSLLKEPFKRLVPYRLRHQIKDRLIKANLELYRYPPLEDEIAQVLRSRYYDEIVHLEILIKRDLSHWLPTRYKQKNKDCLL